jgi:nitric oxide reductase subunit B
LPEQRKRGLLISAGWAQAVMIVFCIGFLVLRCWPTARIRAEPPIPGKVVDPAGRVLFLRSDIVAGQEAFLRNGLMEYGSIFGHGAYGLYGRLPAPRGLRGEQLLRWPGLRWCASTNHRGFQNQSIRCGCGNAHFTPGQAAAFEQLEAYYRGFFTEPST